MLRKNRNNRVTIRTPATCHGAIPDLSPGRYWHSLASMDYTLIMCGGMDSKKTSSSFSLHFKVFLVGNGAHQSSCYCLETDMANATWNSMRVCWLREGLNRKKMSVKFHTFSPVLQSVNCSQNLSKMEIPNIFIVRCSWMEIDVWRKLVRDSLLEIFVKLLLRLKS